ncbi:MAG: hypothetical protein GXO75_06160 [Calditrichaeota bacterium]|nr:hypothetical protein [Calditrichota bacterium]
MQLNRIIILICSFCFSLGSFSCSKDQTPISPQPSLPDITWASQPITVVVPENGGVWYPRLLQWMTAPYCALLTRMKIQRQLLSVSQKAWTLE